MTEEQKYYACLFGLADLENPPKIFSMKTMHKIVHSALINIPENLKILKEQDQLVLRRYDGDRCTHAYLLMGYTLEVHQFFLLNLYPCDHVQPHIPYMERPLPSKFGWLPERNPVLDKIKDQQNLILKYGLDKTLESETSPKEMLQILNAVFGHMLGDSYSFVHEKYVYGIEDIFFKNNNTGLKSCLMFKAPGAAWQLDFVNQEVERVLPTGLTTKKLIWNQDILYNLENKPYQKKLTEEEVESQKALYGTFPIEGEVGVNTYQLADILNAKFQEHMKEGQFFSAVDDCVFVHTEDMNTRRLRVFGKDNMNRGVLYGLNRGNIIDPKSIGLDHRGRTIWDKDLKDGPYG